MVRVRDGKIIVKDEWSGEESMQREVRSEVGSGLWVRSWALQERMGLTARRRASAGPQERDYCALLAWRKQKV